MKEVSKKKLVLEMVCHSKIIDVTRRDRKKNLDIKASLRMNMDRNIITAYACPLMLLIFKKYVFE